MSNTLEIINSFTASIDGNPYQGKQGEIASLITDAFEISLTSGVAHIVPGSLATAAVVTVFDDDDDVPIDWVYFWLWTEVAMYVQVINTVGYFITKTQAKVPYTMSVDSILTHDSSTTAISGGSEPSLTDIDSIVLGNYTGGAGKYLAVFFN